MRPEVIRARPPDEGRARDKPFRLGGMESERSGDSIPAGEVCSAVCRRQSAAQAQCRGLCESGQATTAPAQ
jgi:hypothetical protein